MTSFAPLRDFRAEPLRSFGRQKGRPLSARQQGLIDALLPAITVPVSPQSGFDPLSLMPNAKATWLEIGFGGGEHLVGQATRHPDTLIIGIEPFIEGVAKALTGIDAGRLGNVRLLADDSRPFVAALADGCLDRVYILFPDPWPKPRQRKRRIFQPELLEALARVMKPGAELRFATDVASYAEWALELLQADKRFVDLAAEGEDLTAPPVDHVTTRYQQKGLGDCAPVFFRFQRVEAPVIR